MKIELSKNHVKRGKKPMFFEIKIKKLQNKRIRIGFEVKVKKAEKIYYNEDCTIETFSLDIEEQSILVDGHFEKTDKNYELKE